jgi:hypothetical protein
MNFWRAAARKRIFLSCREDLSNSLRCLCVSRGQKSLATEIPEALRVLCVKVLEAPRARRVLFWSRLTGLLRNFAHQFQFNCS